MLTWGQVVINGLLAAALIVIFYNYPLVIAAILGLAPEAAEKIPALEIVSFASIIIAVWLASIMYALAVDHTPQRLFKGIAIALIATLTYSTLTATEIAYFIGGIIRQVVGWLYGTPIAGFLFSTMLSVAGLIVALNALNAITGAVLTGLILAAMPTIFAMMSYIYTSLVYNPLKDAILKFIKTFAVKTRLGFLMPIALYVTSIVLFIIYSPVLLFMIFFSFGVLLGAIVSILIGGLAKVVIDMIAFGVGVLLITSAMPWVTRILQNVPNEILVTITPMTLFIIALLGIVPILLITAYSIALVPAVALVISIAVVTSPSVRGKLDRYIPVFFILFILQLILTLIGAAIAAKSQPEAAVNSMIFTLGVIRDKDLGGNPVAILFKPQLEILLKWMNYTLRAMPAYNYTTQCFMAKKLPWSVPAGDKTGQTPPYWWVDMALWFNPQTAAQITALYGYTDPYDIACYPKRRVIV